MYTRIICVLYRAQHQLLEQYHRTGSKGEQQRYRQQLFDDRTDHFRMAGRCSAQNNLAGADETAGAAADRLGGQNGSGLQTDQAGGCHLEAAEQNIAGHIGTGDKGAEHPHQRCQQGIIAAKYRREAAGQSCCLAGAAHNAGQYQEYHDRNGGRQRLFDAILQDAAAAAGLQPPTAAEIKEAKPGRQKQEYAGIGEAER